MTPEHRSNSANYIVSYWHTNSMANVSKYKVIEEEFSSWYEAEKRMNFINQKDNEAMAYMFEKRDEERSL